MVSARAEPGADRFWMAVWPLRDANWLPDQLRTVVFGPAGQEPESATFTIFDAEVRIATNVALADGRRATGTRVSDEVARRVLGEGRPWTDRAFVVDRWVIAVRRLFPGRLA